jgi:hypothetical protein
MESVWKLIGRIGGFSTTWRRPLHKNGINITRWLLTKRSNNADYVHELENYRYKKPFASCFNYQSKSIISGMINQKL